MDEVYKPGAVSSLIHLQTPSDAAEKSRKEQKKLDKLFGRLTTKKDSPTISITIPQDDYSDDVSKNFAVKIKSSKKKKKKEKIETCEDSEEVESSSKKKKKKEKKNKSSFLDDDINNNQEDSLLGEKKNDKINHVKEKKRNNEDIISNSAKKPKKFKVASDDKQSKKRKKRKMEEEEVVTCTSGQDEEGDDTSSEKKKKTKLNKGAEGTSDTLSFSSKKPRQKTTPPVINDVLCAMKESDGSKSRTRTTKKQDLSDIEDEDGQQVQKRQKQKRDKRNDQRTVFVGNIPLTMTKKQLKQMFTPCGEVENLRMRGAIPANPQRGKKYAILKKAYHSKCLSINAYVCFVDKESAGKACKMMNGKEVEGQHIRVNSSIISKTVHDHKRSVFIGNLPFVISDEDVRQHFLDCGEIANIRLVRDWKTGIGKGFGYVKFEDTDSAELAVRLDNSKLKTRKIRVLPSETDPKNKRTDKGPEKKKIIKKKDEKDFVGMKAEKKKKKLKPKHVARKLGLASKKTDITPQKVIEKTTDGPNKHMVFE